MPFSSGNTNAKKDFYKMFVCLLNDSLATITTAFTALKTHLRNYTNSPKETYGTGVTVALTNSANELVIINDPTTTTVTITGITDAKLRLVANLKASGAVTVAGTSVPRGQCLFINGTTAVTTVCPFFPLGACLAEPSFTNEKGDEVKINTGNSIVVNDSTKISTVIADACDDLQVLLSSFAPVGYFILAIKSNQNVYLQGVNPFVAMKINGNGLNQSTFDVVKETTLLMTSIIEG